MDIQFLPFDQMTVDSLRKGGPDAYGKPAEVAVSDGSGNPCRSCLADIPKGSRMLVCAGKPFSKDQPYAETGPVFFCADACKPYQGNAIPPTLASGDVYLLKGYTADERIKYGTGKIVPVTEMIEYAKRLLSRDDVAYVDVRSARNNCYQTRIVISDDGGS